MTSREIEATTALRLQTYSRHASRPFSDEVMGTVSEQIARQSRIGSYQKVLELAGVPSRPATYRYTDYAPLQVAHRRPRHGNYDPRHGLVVDFGIDSPLDENNLYRFATLAGMLPNTQMVAKGNPGPPGYGAGRISFLEGAGVARKQNFSPLIDPSEIFLDSIGIETTDNTSESLGTELMVARMLKANRKIEHAVAKEPVVGRRNPVELLLALKTTTEALEDYVNANALPTFEAARAATPGDAAYALGILRATNLAAGWALRPGNFMKRMDKALTAQPGAKAAFVYGSDSELCAGKPMNDGYLELHARHGGYTRLDAMRIEGGRHLMFNDLALSAAVDLQFLTDAGYAVSGS